ncbi:glycoprotein 6-alpha-L-fucosyltransferase [Entomortierella parvispora]|uniref:Glycoprotein 6-alpha-L-fucosyltransferase n=1 Tax=Entomortierella parvispora TaxID=205924 RepID=A0A9P3LY45_9FUNG|nr:glycoprotein 6-alpha-L-fucosyltransferase [Entomortierella parvispora]
MALPTLTTAQRTRYTSQPLLRRWLLLICTLSVMFTGVYLILLSTSTGSFGSVEWLEKWPNCPIHSAPGEICVHSGVSHSDLRDVCGKLKMSTGHCQDRHYDVIVVSSSEMKNVHSHTYTMIVPGKEIGQELDAFVQRHSRWMIDTLGTAEGFEKLTTFSNEDKHRVALQQGLDLLQHRCARFFSGAINPNGFGSTWHNIGLGLAHALFYDMTLMTPDQSKLSIPLTTCTEAQMEQAFQVNPPTTIYQHWDESTINYKSLGSDVMDLLEKNTTILPEFLPKGYFWWRSMLTYYAVRPNAQLREILRSLPRIPRPCIAIHVRHSDKIIEAQLIDFAMYMEEAERIKARTGISDIYLMTDDHQVIKSTRKYPDFQFHYIDLPRTNRGWQVDVLTGIPRPQLEINFLKEIYSAVQCQHFVLTYSSNVGRLIAEIAYATQNKAPEVVSVDGKWFMFP